MENGRAWLWYCSRRCSGAESGRRNRDSGLLERYLHKAAEGRYRLMNERRQAFFRDEAASLARYGVPLSVAMAVLDRTFQLGTKHGRDVTWRRAMKQRAA